MDISKILSIFTNLSPLEIDSNLCSHVITPKSSCQKCIQACTTQNISFENGAIQTDNCIYCGRCVSACPNHVFKLNEDQLIHQCSPEKPLIITCSNFQKNISHKHPGIININCLAQLYPELIIKLLADSKCLILCVNQLACNNCLNFNYSSLLENLKIFKLFLEKIIIINNYDDLKNYLSKQNKQIDYYDNDRRMFFKSIFNNVKNIPKNLLEPQAPPTPANSEISTIITKKKFTKRKYLYDTLRKYKSAINLSSLLPYRKLTITTCNFCETCVKLCPTGALQIKQIKEEKYLSFTPYLCTECNICQDTCFFESIKWSDNLSISEFIQTNSLHLISATKKVCPTCEKSFWELPGTKTQCIKCTQRAQKN